MNIQWIENENYVTGNLIQATFIVFHFLENSDILVEFQVNHWDKYSKNQMFIHETFTWIYSEYFLKEACHKNKSFDKKYITEIESVDTFYAKKYHF